MHSSYPTSWRTTRTRSVGYSCIRLNFPNEDNCIASRSLRTLHCLCEYSTHVLALFDDSGFLNVRPRGQVTREWRCQFQHQLLESAQTVRIFLLSKRGHTYITRFWWCTPLVPLVLLVDFQNFSGSMQIKIEICKRMKKRKFWGCLAPLYPWSTNSNPNFLESELVDGHSKGTINDVMEIWWFVS